MQKLSEILVHRENIKVLKYIQWMVNLTNLDTFKQISFQQFYYILKRIFMHLYIIRMRLKLKRSKNL